MQDYKKLNRILGYVVAGIAFICYLMTLEPTVSWWDCGEYIATANSLQVGHPPGSPTFQLIGRFFSLFAFGNRQHVALMINIMSALCSALTIMFLFWTITMLAKKILPKESEMTKGQLYAILGSGLVGSLAFAFSDSFWFSAVEGEVYAMSAFCTSLVFWAMLKWETVADEKHSLRWIIFIAFTIGLAIGVHLLNILTIPAIAFIYYFRKFKPTQKGIIFVTILSILILAIVMYVIIPGIVRLSGMFELFFVNTIGMPFDSGTIIYFVLLIGLIVWGLIYTRRKGKAVLNTILLTFVFILIGYSSFLMIVIRANAGPPINENNPGDAVSLLAYLNREQYGETPLFYGPYYNAPVVDYKDGTPIYIHDSKKGKYTITDERRASVSVYDKRFETFFPRMWSDQKSSHINLYKQYGKIKGTPITITGDDGKSRTEYCPTFSENLRFFFSYQLNWMYFRYFMWNFVGRQNDVESQGEPENGNWISGIGFIDNARLGDQSNLPIEMHNAARNKFFFFPLILGLVGLFYHWKMSKQDTWVIFLLFFMTGIAIVLYLNQTPAQPRERDYSYVGSFYAFAVWIGLGVLSLYEWLKKWIKKEILLAGGITAICLLLVPLIMANQGWDDHDRSGKYAARDFAHNYLQACDKNSILVTFGDNDTFPLWYEQEVEGYRTDVRVVNHMLASGHWYVQQMFKKAYESDPLKLTLSYDQYENGVNNYIPVVTHPSLENKYTELSQLIQFIATENDQAKLNFGAGRMLHYMPTKKIRLTVDRDKCVRNGIVPPELADQIVPYIEWEINQNALYKNDLFILDFLATNDWERSFFVANPSSLDGIIGFDKYFHQQGMVYKFMPVVAKGYYKDMGGVDAEKTYDLFTNCQWGNLNDPKVTVDRESYRNSRLPKQNYLRAAEVLVSEGKKDSAATLLDVCLKFFPFDKFPYDMLMMPFAEIYYDAGQTDKANDILTKLADVYSDDLRYYYSLDPQFAKAYYSEDMQRSVSILHRLGQIADEHGQKDLSLKINTLFQEYMKQP